MPAALRPVPAAGRPQCPGGDGAGRGRGGGERGSRQPVPGPPGEAAGYFYPVAFAECAADLPSGARKFPPSASFPFSPPFPLSPIRGGAAGGGPPGPGMWRAGARAGAPGGAAARIGGSGDGEQVSEPSLRVGPAGGPRGADGEGEERSRARTPSAGGGGGQRRSGARRAASQLSRGSGGRGAGAAALPAASAAASAGAARFRGGQLLRQTFKGGLPPEAVLNHGGFDRSTRTLLPFGAGKVKL